MAKWGEGTDVWYSASFYLPLGFYAAKNTSNDIMRWDAYVNGEQDMQGGLGMRSDDTLRIMSNYSYTEPLKTSYKIPEGQWTQVEVHQKISETNGKALNEIYVDGDLIGSSTTANFKGSAYPEDEQAINRLRVGLVSEGSVSDTNTLYFDKVVVSKAGKTTSDSEPTPVPTPTTPPTPTDENIIFKASQENGSLSEWHATSVSDRGASIRAVRAADAGIPKADGDYVVKAKISGSGSDYARTQFQHDDAGVAKWGEGTDVWYSASFYLPLGFYAAKNTSNDIMRWDAYVNGEQDMQGGLGMRSDDTLRIMSNYSYSEPLKTSYKIPEGQWTQVEVHQKISETNGKALNEIYVDGDLIGSSTTANFKGSAYPEDEQAINRLRVGLVSEGSVSDTNTLYFDKVVVSKAGTTTSGSEPTPAPTPTLLHPYDSSHADRREHHLQGVAGKRLAQRVACNLGERQRSLHPRGQGCRRGDSKG